jgi:asparagine synthase (glutamine-hydrolysing)
VLRAFCGWVSWPSDSSDESAIVSRMFAREHRARDISVRSGDGFCLALAEGPAGAAPARGDIASSCGFDVLWTGSPQLTSTAHAGLAEGLAGWCADALDSRGAPESALGGHFAMLAVQSNGARCVLVVDRFSTQPIYYATVGEGLVFGSSPRVVAAHPAVDSALSMQSVHDFLYSTVVPAPNTIYAQVSTLRPGHALRFDSGRVSEFVHWQATFIDEGPSWIGTAAEREVIDCLTEAVRASLLPSAQGGCFLSGGMDSSAVVGCFSKVIDEQARAFSIGFDVDGYDELSYARLAAEHFDAGVSEYYVSPSDIVDLIPRVAKAFGQPFGNSSVIPTFHCAKMAREHGIDFLLAGDGGDEVFGGNERYGRDWIFSRYELLPKPLRSVLQSWACAQSPVLGTLPVMRKAVSYVRYASIELPARTDVFNYLNMLGGERVFDREFLAAVDPQHALNGRREIFEAAKSHSDVHRMMALDFAITLADNDLQKVSVMCDQADVEVAYPFLQDNVVDFSLRLPATDKVRRTQLRHFFRTAMKNFLPQEVLAKSKHGFGLPFGIWATQDQKLRSCVFDILASARSRGFFSPTFLDDLTNSLLDAEPRYYGPLVWQIVTLETWLSENT